VRPIRVRIVWLVALAAVVVTPALALAHPPPEIAEDEPIEWHHDRAMFEWSSWIRLAYGIQRETTYGPPQSSPRTDAATPPATTTATKLEDQTSMIDAGLGADVTFPIPTSKVRLGPWIELRPHGTFVGAELNIAGSPLDMFWTDGEHVTSIRAGSSLSDITGQLAYGFRCPWKLSGPWNPSTRYMIGVRFVGSFTQSREDRGDWNASFGLEFEPIGSLRYLAGIRSWY
jgi:hypothetical protein